jgi:hypothetical protein
MNARSRSPLVFVLLLGSVGALGVVATASAAEKVKSDLVASDKRRVSVELAQQLTRPPEPAPLPANLAQPFNPPGFDLPDLIEPAPSAPGATAPGSSGRDESGTATRPAPAAGDRETIENLAAKIPATGTIVTPRGDRVLSFGSKNVRIGAHFTVTSNGQDYDLVLVTVDSTTFTVRYRNEEVTRPIKPGK